MFTRRWLALTGAAIFGWLATCGACAGQEREAVVVTVDRTERHQTILGWGKCAPHQIEVPEPLRNLVIERAVDDLGLTRLRLEPPSGNRSTHRAWEWLNDDDDPYHINWSAFNVGRLHAVVSEWVVPFKKRVEARGEPFDIYVSPSFFDHGSSGTAPAWLVNSPEEYAEYAMALLLRLRDKFGIEANYYCICNEAGNDNLFGPGPVLDAICALGRRIEQAGLKTRIQFPECVNPRACMSYLREAEKRPEVWKYIGLISYHLYGPVDDIPLLRDVAAAHSLPTAQTEFMGLTIDHLVHDLTAGSVSYWEIYGLGGVQDGSIGAYVSSRSFNGGPNYWSWRQVLHYVRPGAVRIGARAEGGSVRSMAFEQRNGVTVLLINVGGAARPATVSVRGLPEGEYGVARSVAGRPYEEVGIAKGGETLTVEVPAGCVATIYPHTHNLAPVVTDWYAEPSFLELPQGDVVLYCRAVDAEGERLAYRWSYAEGPDGAEVRIAEASSASTRVSGLTVPGWYRFDVAVSDGAHRVTKSLWLAVFRGNQAPRIMDVHNRIPVQVRLPQNSTELRGGAWDIEGDKLQYRWAVVSQPAGAAALLEAPGEQKCRVTGMDVPGEYVFEFTVSDRSNVVRQTHKVPVYAANHPPRIVRVEAVPQTVSARIGRCELVVGVLDEDGDPVTVYWQVRQAPQGTEPVIARPGAKRTDAGNMTVPGRYVFEVRAIDNGDVTRASAVVDVVP